jgi:hypothetical protein
MNNVPIIIMGGAIYLVLFVLPAEAGIQNYNSQTDLPQFWILVPQHTDLGERYKPHVLLK